MQSIKYVHTNIVTDNWQKLAKFYHTVFGCEMVPPKRHQAGSWLEKGTGVKNASLEGVHMRLPGCGDEGPTLEIYQYGKTLDSQVPAANRKGFGHLAFEVEDVESVLHLIMANDGSAIGQFSETTIDGLGKIKFVYAADPDGNILEIQQWFK